MAYKGIEYLRAKLASKRDRVLLRYKYYEMKNDFYNPSKLIPPIFKNLKPVLGWCAKGVDSIADRLVFDGFKNDNFLLDQIFDMNSRDIFFDDAVLSALISSCCFVYISEGKYNEPRLQVIDGSEATGEIDPITRMLTEGYAVIERDEMGDVKTEAYFVPGTTYIYRVGQKKPEAFTNKNVPYAALVPIVYRPDAKRPFGHSRISRACMELTQEALRTQLRFEVASEFYSFPQKYILGLDPKALFENDEDKVKAYMTSILQISKDDDGEKPVVGQFQQATMTPYNDSMKNIASLFAGEMGLTLDDLGYATANPATAEAIAASHENLRLTARKAQRTFGSGFLNVGYLAACIRDKREYDRSVFYETKPRWAPLYEPSASQLGGIGDAIAKLRESFPDYFDEEKLHELTGI